MGIIDITGVFSIFDFVSSCTGTSLCLNCVMLWSIVMAFPKLSFLLEYCSKLHMDLCKSVVERPVVSHPVHHFSKSLVSVMS